MFILLYVLGEDATRQSELGWPRAFCVCSTQNIPAVRAFRGRNGDSVGPPGSASLDACRAQPGDVCEQDAGPCTCLVQPAKVCQHTWKGASRLP